MSLPKLQPGLVISYQYLWAREHDAGHVEGAKARPCAIVAARQVIQNRDIATVVPITHSAPRERESSIEIPRTIKFHLGLDEAHSWIVLTEVNDFIWPGPDLVPVSRQEPNRFHYGMLPPKFFAHLRDRILELHARQTLKTVPRTE